MICPRCSIADISEDTHQCPLCGFAPSGNVLVEPAQDEILEAVQEALDDRFQIQAVLRLGERSFVYLAQESAHERLVALKVMPVAELVDHELANRFEQRAAVAAALKHSHIVPLHTYGASRNFLWYAMEYVQGQSLAEVLRTSGPMDLSTCLRIVEQVASALDHAHRQDVVHGNLKPTNIFIDDEKWVRVSDFAVLDAFGRPTSPKQGAPVLHRPEYMAPEQFYARTVGASADQYAFAVLVYQCLSGTLPFVGDSFEEVARLHANEPPPRLSHLRPDLPLHVLEAIQRALSKVPGGRFATVLDFASALATGPSARASTSRLASTSRASVEATPVLVVAPNRRQQIRRLAIGATVVGLFGTVGALAITRPPFVQRILDVSGRMVGAVTGSEPSNADSPSLRWETLERPPAQNRIDPAVMDSVPGGDPVIVIPERQPRREIVPPTPAQLFVNASPWGTVYIDGKSIGNTPKANVEMMPGVHTIRIERAGFELFEQEFTVKAGEVLRLLDIVLKPRQQ